MIRHILKTIRNERTRNIGLVLELFLVAVALWYLMDYTIAVTRNYVEPLNFDTEHTYIVRMGYLSGKSAEYNAEAENESLGENVFKVLERVGVNPMVEAASISVNSSPHIGSNSFYTLFNDTINTENAVLRRQVTPGFFHVFRYKSVNGSTAELSDAIERGECILSEGVEKEIFPDGPGIRETFSTGNDEQSAKLRIGAISTDIRYDNFSDSKKYFAMPLTAGWIDENFGKGYIPFLELCVRAKPEEDHDFIHRFREQMTPQFRVGNLYLKTIQSIPVNKKAYQRDDMNELYIRYFIILFLLVNIFLGISGTFWFRTQERRGEIGLRMALGSTPGGILRIFYLEGTLLLTLAVIPVMIIFIFVKEVDFLYAPDTYNAARYFTDFAGTYLLLLGMILLSILSPAKKAAGISPVDALRDE